jgi:hypothetical protein
LDYFYACYSSGAVVIMTTMYIQCRYIVCTLYLVEYHMVVIMNFRCMLYVHCTYQNLQQNYKRPMDGNFLPKPHRITFSRIFCAYYDCLSSKTPKKIILDFFNFFTPCYSLLKYCIFRSKMTMHINFFEATKPKKYLQR